MSLQGPHAPEAPQAPKTKPIEKLLLPPPIRTLREAIGVVLWTALIIEFFVVDFVGPATQQLPWLHELVHYRLLLILGLLSALLLLLGGRLFILFVGYIVAYPFVLVFWHLPKLLFRNWAMLIAFAPAIYSTIATFKWRFAFFTLALISATAILVSVDQRILICSMVFLGFYLVMHYIRRFRAAFSPSTVFRTWVDNIRASSDKLPASMYRMPEDIKPGNPKYEEQLTQNLLGIYFASSMLLYLARGIKGVLQSRKLDIYYICSLVYTFMMTVLTFALLYFALEKVFPGSFKGLEGSPDFWSFLGLSFGTLWPGDISPLRGASSLAQTLRYAEHLASALIALLVVFVVLTSIRERHKRDLEILETELSNTSEAVGGYLADNYELTVAAAEAWIFKHSPTLLKPLLKLRYGKEADGMLLRLTVAESPNAPSEDGG